MASSRFSSDSPNMALLPTPERERVFAWRDHAALWFSMGVGLLVMQIGAYLVPAMGSRDAAIAIVVGSVLGAGLLACTARLGSRTGLSSAGLLHATFGRLFARLPVVLNMAQLLGWTAFELVVMRDGTLAIAAQSLGLDPAGKVATLGATMLWGLALVMLLLGTMVNLVRKVVSRVALPLVVASLAWLSWQFGSQVFAQGSATFWSRAGDGSMGLLSALDLVIAMPVSWLPLVADYARHGRTARGALGGTWLGYALANIWCYALGVLAVAVVPPGTDLVAALLLAQGGLIALTLILVDEVDNAYGDVYSAAVSGHSLRSAWTLRQWGMGTVVVATSAAVVLPMHSLEPFLLLLSSVFVPLFGVVLGRLGGQTVTSPSAKVHWGAAALWLLGIAAYHALSQWAPQWGAALPTLALTYALAWATRKKV